MGISVGDNIFGTPFGIEFKAICCANDRCKEPSLEVFLKEYYNGTLLGNGKTYGNWVLRPDGAAKPLAEYIPVQIREDYREACLIAHLSPKASATLARRCLQGMIRDFGEVKPGRLFDEIAALAAGVEDGTAPRDVSIDSIAALTSLRKIGNIGAHMEGDVDLIIPVETEEAKALLSLIELLLDEWYVERHKRKERFAKVEAIEEEKAALIKNGRTKALPAPTPNVEPEAL